MKKYKLLLDDYTTIRFKSKEIKLFRIEALLFINDDVQKGDKGGFVQNENNLDQSDESWIFDDAKVFNNARIFDSGKVMGNAIISDYSRVFQSARVMRNAIVTGSSSIYGSSTVYYNSEISKGAEIFGQARVGGNARIENSIVCGSAKITQNAKIRDRCYISGRSIILGTPTIINSRISDDVKISSDIKLLDATINRDNSYMVCGPLHDNKFITVTDCNKKIMVGQPIQSGLFKSGFYGDLLEFKMWFNKYYSKEPLKSFYTDTIQNYLSEFITKGDN